MNPEITKLIQAQHLIREAAFPPETPPTPSTPRLKKVLALASRESKHRKHGYIGTEHLLVGLLLDGEGLPAKYLKSMGCTIEDAYQILDSVES